MIFKYGIYRRASIYISKRDYRAAYKILIDHFDIYQIKCYYDLNYNKDKYYLIYVF